MSAISLEISTTALGAMPIAMNGYSLESSWATRKLTVVVGGYGS
jgi:hypothetical protein